MYRRCLSEIKSNNLLSSNGKHIIIKLLSFTFIIIIIVLTYIFFKGYHTDREEGTDAISFIDIV